MISSKRRETLNDKHTLMLQKYLNKSPKKALVCESKPKQNLKFQDKLSKMFLKNKKIDELMNSNNKAKSINELIERNKEIDIKAKFALKHK